MVDHAPLIERAFTLDVHEHACDVSLEGTLPPVAPGTCYWNGPARFARGGIQYRNWLDGDGLVCGLSIGNGPPRVGARFVRSEKFVQEEAAGRPLFRMFGTAFDGDRLKRGIGLEASANVSVFPYGAALLAFGEQGLPWELDPETLATKGPYTFDGQLNEVTPFAAHPKFDPRSGEMFNFGVSFSAERPTLNVFRFGADGRLVYRRRVPLPYPSSIHDFALSASYAVFYVGPFVLDIAALMQGGAPLMKALHWEPERGSHLMIVERATGELVSSLPIGRKYCLHLVNAYEASGRLIVDVVEYERPIYDQYQVIPALFTDVPVASPVRLRIDLSTYRIVERRELEYSCAPDFPAHDVEQTGQAYSEFWMLGISATGQAGRKFFDELVRLHWETGEVETYRAPAGHYLGGEPLFVPDPEASGGGVVICQSFDAARAASAFVVFDASHVSRGPLATIRMSSPVPPLFHSSFLRHGGGARAEARASKHGS